MPITGPASYLPTTDEFLGHWEVADATLGAGNEIVLPGGDESGRVGDAGGPACFKLGAQHRKLRTDIESEMDVVPV
jgi:hypothetical protein